MTVFFKILLIFYISISSHSFAFSFNEKCLAPLSKANGLINNINEFFINKVLLLLSEDESRTIFPEDNINELAEIFQNVNDEDKYDLLVSLMKKNRPNGSYFIHALIQHEKIMKIRDKITGLDLLLFVLGGHHTDRDNRNTSCFHDEVFALNWLIPNIISRLNSGFYDSIHKMKIVSLGASRLQEAYSILIELKRHYQANREKWKNNPLDMISFVCIEKDEEVLNEGIKGSFIPFDVINIRNQPWYFNFFGELMPGSNFKSNFYTKVNLLKRSVRDEFLKVITPVCDDFLEMDDTVIENADYVLLNGVTIYLNENEKYVIAKKINRWLTEDGILLTTAAEKYFNEKAFTIINQDIENKSIIPMNRIFQKNNEYDLSFIFEWNFYAQAA